MRISFPHKIVGTTEFMHGILDMHKANPDRIIEIHSLPKDLIDPMLCVGIFELENVKLKSIRKKGSWHLLSVEELLACAYCKSLTKEYERQCKSCGAPKLRIDPLTSRYLPPKEYT